MSMEQIFAGAQKERDKLTNTTIKRISGLYENIANDINKQLTSLNSKSTISSILRAQYLEALAKEINSQIGDTSSAVEASIQSGMQETAQAMVDNVVAWSKGIGLNITGAYSHVPTDIVENIISGNLYKGRWNLSGAIWRDIKRSQSDIDFIVAQGIAANKSSLEIAKDLEKYVNPSARKDWNWSKVYPNTKQKIDYNAQRLSRTMISHAYEESLVQTTKDNPFFEGYKWLTSNHDGVCDLCRTRATAYHGVDDENGKPLYGVFAKGALPLDHPNGKCTFATVMIQDMDSVVDDLADWVNGKSNPELDKYAKSMGYTSSQLKSKIGGK